ncbi:unnamed protein product [Trichobilharzia szidati]|nr:unnamed protein product [Trichobilharzia szidati]
METVEKDVFSLDKFETLSLNDTPNPNEETNENSNCLDEEFCSDQDLDQKDEIRSALVQQTKDLYEHYAKEQFPRDPDKQKELIAEMQEQYFDHYLSEVYRFQIIHQQQQLEQLREIKSVGKKSDDTNGEYERDSPVSLPLIPATIWTRKDIAEFKREILDVQKECCIKIGSLATATVRVPTHPNGKAICWEFATDYYDLGFGLYFEWDLEPPENISVNISESSDEEGGEEDDEDGPSYNNNSGEKPSPENGDKESPHDLELGKRSSQPRVPTDELIPIYRRDCHTEVYCGTHQYPGVGVYVFKFDNSFSLWRSKWLYYRIFYTH